jgi:hypothetical protein
MPALVVASTPALVAASVGLGKHQGQVGRAGSWVLDIHSADNSAAEIAERHVVAIPREAGLLLEDMREQTAVPCTVLAVDMDTAVDKKDTAGVLDSLRSFLDYRPGVELAAGLREMTCIGPVHKLAVEGFELLESGTEREDQEPVEGTETPGQAVEEEDYRQLRNTPLVVLGYCLPSLRPRENPPLSTQLRRADP